MASTRGHSSTPVIPASMYSLSSARASPAGPSSSGPCVLVGVRPNSLCHSGLPDCWERRRAAGVELHRAAWLSNPQTSCTPMTATARANAGLAAMSPATDHTVALAKPEATMRMRR